MFNQGDYSHPFTSGTEKVIPVSLREQSFHLAVGYLCCFDVRQSTEDKKPHLNWFDQDNTFISDVRRAAQHTDLFWVMFFKVAANLRDASKHILEANSSSDIKAFCACKRSSW